MGALSITGLADIKTAVRAPGARGHQGAQHQLLPGQVLRRRRRGLRSVGRRRHRAGHPHRRARRRWRPSSWSRCRMPVAASPRLPATSSGCARSATATACSWCPTRSSAPSAGSGTGSAPSATTTAPTSSPWPRGSPAATPHSGAMAVSDRLVEPFLNGASFLHGVTFGGHPVSTAVAMANLDVFEKEHLLENVRKNEGAFRGVARHPPRPAHRRGCAGCGVLLRDRAGQGQGHP